MDILGKEDAGCGGSSDCQSSSSAQDGLYTEGLKSVELKLPAEPPTESSVDDIQSPYSLTTFYCRKYQRPNKAPSDTVDGSSQLPGVISSKVYSVSAAAASNTIANTSNTAAKPAAAATLAPAAAPQAVKGRQSMWEYEYKTRQYPISTSVTSVTIDDPLWRSLAIPAATDLEKAGQMKKFRPTQFKTKKETKLEYFGFEDQEGLESGGAVGHSSYFGFDDLSESDSDGENTQAKEKKEAAAVLGTSVDRPQTCINTDQSVESSLQVQMCYPARTVSIQRESDDPEAYLKQEPEDHLKQEPEVHIKQEPEEHIKQEPEEHIKQEPEVHIKQEPEVHIKQEPEVHIKQEPEVHIKQEPEVHIKQEPEEHIKQEPEEHIKREPEDHLDTNALDFSDDCSPGVTNVQKVLSGSPGDKSKDAGLKKILSGLKKILSGPKKVTTGRGPLYQEMASQTYSTLSEYQREMNQGFGLFDAMMQPVVELYRIAGDSTDYHRERSTVSREMASKIHSTLSEGQREIHKGCGPFDAMLQPVVKLYRMEFLPVCKEEMSPEKRSTSLVQEYPHIKDEQEELLQRPENGDWSTQTLLIVKNFGENREPVASTSPQHMKTQADVDKKMLSCTECGKMFKFKGQLKDHIMIHTGEKPCTCKVCGKGFRLMGMLKLHMRSHSGERPFTCKVCVKSFNQKIHLNNHIMIHTREKPFVCKVCDKGFSRKETLKMHMRSHTGEKPFTCEDCGKGFSDKGNLKLHMKTHTGERPFTCGICGKCFSRAHVVKSHMRIHTGEKPFTCTVCGKGFANNDMLKNHKRTHTGEKPFSCTVCGRGCRLMQQLKLHMRTHTGEKPLTCKVCGKSFSRDLNVHMRTHTGEKPFLCTVCGKGCVNSSNLKQHMRTHTGEKPFSCTGCGRCFSDKGALKRHFRIHTREKPFTCTVCGKGYKKMHQLKKHIRMCQLK